MLINLQCGWCGNIFSHDCEEANTALTFGEPDWLEPGSPNRKAILALVNDGPAIGESRL